MCTHGLRIVWGLGLRVLGAEIPTKLTSRFALGFAIEGVRVGNGDTQNIWSMKRNLVPLGLVYFHTAFSACTTKDSCRLGFYRLIVRCLSPHGPKTRRESKTSRLHELLQHSKVLLDTQERWGYILLHLLSEQHGQFFRGSRVCQATLRGLSLLGP